jgi:hypothetical protein
MCTVYIQFADDEGSVRDRNHLVQDRKGNLYAKYVTMWISWLNDWRQSLTNVVFWGMLALPFHWHCSWKNILHGVWACQWMLMCYQPISYRWRQNTDTTRNRIWKLSYISHPNYNPRFVACNFSCSFIAMKYSEYYHRNILCSYEYLVISIRTLVWFIIFLHYTANRVICFTIRGGRYVWASCEGGWGGYLPRGMWFIPFPLLLQSLTPICLEYETICIYQIHPY